MFIHGPGWEGFKYIKSFMLEVCTVYIPFSSLHVETVTKRKSWRILDNEWQNKVKFFLFFCSDLKQKKLKAVFLICHWMLIV